ncbi:glycosyltransferase [Leadbettera azotonutricia]|uniref:Glycosyltransferase, group 2 family n=1 Tax=Leadbettera azotonutricia (strain ATCC BAA-888 / DSM 13862 / ZAS-9) TaxID=545695 RepID=F5YB72_LEAAZ|nr:glycosyltransferase [Leadbettera azotonutricia]AEF80903.1 glycosyltransferase, group 2 family [Leadbettera azotonutricia ZAS-9]
MLLYNIFRFGFALVFVGLHAALMAGLYMEWKRDKRARFNPAAVSWMPKVTVIIPVHNESSRMEGIFRSLETQDYPEAEFIFIDDRSSDESAQLISAFLKNKPSMRLISLTENPGFNHKQFALARGIEVSSGEFFLFTDADCEIPQGWIAAMVKRMADKKVGAAIGPVLKRSGGQGFFHLYQCFEHGVRFMYLAGSTGLGAAGGGFGNNLILRRASLEAVGGYESIPPSPTEDAALVSRIRACSDFQIRAALGPDVHVITKGELGWKDFINQTLRWNNGGLFSPDFSTRLNFGFLMVTISMGILAIPFLPFFPSIWPLPAAVILSMTADTIATLGLFGVSLPKKGPAYILQLLFTPVYFTFLTIIGFCGIKPEWKGSKM